jgi:GNAT superfamily N-acetyltransferase
MVGSAAMGVTNLSAFVAATAGRPGRVQPVPGGDAVASAVPLGNGYLNAGFRTDVIVPAVTFLDGLRSVFAAVGSPYVVWVESADDELLSAAVVAGGVPDDRATPAMVVAGHLQGPPDIEVRPVVDTVDRPVFARLCEDGYDIPGLAWLLESQGCFDAPGVTWAIASAGGTDLGVGCGYSDGRTGGIYYVATPPEHRGRGAAAAVTVWLSNGLLDAGASQVTLQASEMGRPVYERLGFRSAGSFLRHTVPAPD